MKVRLPQGHLVSVFILLTSTACLLLSGSVIAQEDIDERLSNLLVHTKNGPIQGIIKKSRNASFEFVSYLGLRYADPPARFEPAKPLDQIWSTPKIANAPGSQCPQPNFEPGKWEENEDCLFLNVHVPKSAVENTEALPVILWIHGGGFAMGDGYSYGAEYFMETEDVILVTTNYRLGLFGFISMGSEDDVFTSNNGLRDIVMALKWVQANIAAFKGNPEKITIAGNSAGSVAVHYLLMSPLAKGLFHGAIMQSGAFSFWSYAPNPRKDASNLALFLDCPNNEDPQQVRKCLEGKSVKDLLIGQTTLGQTHRWPPLNFIGRFLPTAKEPNENAFFFGEPSSFFTFHGQATNYVNQVPVMAGIVRDEGSTLFTAFILAEDNLLRLLNMNWDRIAPKTFSYDGFVPPEKLTWISRRIRDYYFGKAELTKDSIEFLSTLYTDSLFLLPVMEAASDMANNEISVWPYVFSYVSNWSVRDALHLPEMHGTVGHADELQYLFPHPILGAPLPPDSNAEKFSKKFVKFWTSFVQNGKPATEWFEGEELDWKPVQPSPKKSPRSNFDILRINNDPRVAKNFQFADRLDFWRTMLNETAGNAPKPDKKLKHEL